MPSTVFSIVPIIIDTKKLQRLFISSQENLYHPKYRNIILHPLVRKAIAYA